MNSVVYAAFKVRKAQVPDAKRKDPVFDVLPRSWWEDVRENAGLDDYRWHESSTTMNL
ncbi:MAG TPA: hypothetical protein VIJ38_13855 [Acidobacteriaceae bacterium]